MPLVQSLDVSDQAKAILAIEAWSQNSSSSMVSASLVAAGVTKVKKAKRFPSHNETKV